jgi:ABC-type nitrate/sulfonate/bicarbonate transport system substrate-binding protein
MNMRPLLASAVALVLALSAIPAQAAERVIFGSVGSGSANAWPTYIGMAKGFFTEQGLAPDLVHAQSNAAVNQQLAAGSINVATNSGVVDPIRALDKGAAVAILRIEMRSPPYELLGKPGIKSMAELKGKTVSVGGAKDITRIYVQRMLASVKIKPSDIDLIYAGATSARYAALKAGAADAAILAPPFNFRAAGEGYGLLGRAVDYVDLPFACLAVNRTWAAANPGTGARLIAAFNKSMTWFYDAKNRDEAISILLASTKLKKENAAATYKFLHDGKFFEPTGKVSRRRLGAMLDAMRDIGDVSPSLTVDKIVLPGVTQVTD